MKFRLPRRPFGFPDLATGTPAWLEDPFAVTKVDYAYNLAVAGLIRPSNDEVRRSTIVERLLNTGRRRTKARSSHPRDVAELMERRLDSLRIKGKGLGREPRPPAALAANNLAVIADVVNLSQGERKAMEFAVACRDRDMRQLMEPIDCPNAHALLSIVATALNRSLTEIEAVFSAEGRLATTGLLTLGDEGDFEERIDVDWRLVELLSIRNVTADDFLQKFLPRAPRCTLRSEDYGHVGGAVDLAHRVLAGAFREKRAGINILLYGPTGTGKSELARHLADRLDARLFVAGSQDTQGESPKASERMTSLLLGNRVLGTGTNILLFDEMEDLFEWDGLTILHGPQRSARMSKIWFNNLLETNATPTIWIANDLRGVDPAFLRRFSFVIEMAMPSINQRRRIWERHLEPAGGLAPTEIDNLARDFRASPAEIRTAVCATRLALGGNVDRTTLESILGPTQKALYGKARTSTRATDDEYRPELTNTPQNLESIVGALTGWRPGSGVGVSLCLYGPPGTGKSAYVRYIARRLDRPLVVVRPSDLLNCWVGESEKNLARAFDEAMAEGAVLLIDEADSFLSDRRRANASWEITLANELLQNLETFGGIVACTTNLFENIDQAALRRFTFKIPFLPLRPQQAVQFFQRLLCSSSGPAICTLEAETASRDVARISNLTPGDFFAAVRKAKALGDDLTPDRLLRYLSAEVEVKEGTRARIGFGAWT